MSDNRFGVRPVFLDRSGRRRRAVVVAGASLGAGLAATLVVLAAGLSGASLVDSPRWPGSHRNPAVTTQPAPAVDAGVSAVPGGAPASVGPVPTAGPSGSATTQPSRRHVPTQTPSHPKPSKTS